VTQIPEARWGSSESWLARLIKGFGFTRLGSWTIRTLMPVDRKLLVRSNGRRTLLGPIGAPVMLLETTGRKSGEPRQNPVGKGLDGDTFWIVAEHGRRAAYVRNIEADPRVRVRVRRRWRGGTAQILDGEDPRALLRTLPRLNAAGIRAMGTELLAIRIDLDEAA